MEEKEKKCYEEANKNRELFKKLRDDANERLKNSIKANDMQGVKLAQTISKSARQFRDNELGCTAKSKEIDEEIKKINLRLEQARNFKKSKK